MGVCDVPDVPSQQQIHLVKGRHTDVEGITIRFRWDQARRKYGHGNRLALWRDCQHGNTKDRIQPPLRRGDISSASSWVTKDV